VNRAGKERLPAALSLSTATVPSWSLSIRADEDDDIGAGVELSSAG
jgi:hypothetical protein